MVRSPAVSTPNCPPPPIPPRAVTLRRMWALSSPVQSSIQNPRASADSGSFGVYHGASSAAGVENVINVHSWGMTSSS